MMKLLVVGFLILSGVAHAMQRTDELFFTYKTDKEWHIACFDLNDNELAHYLGTIDAYNAKKMQALVTRELEIPPRFVDPTALIRAARFAFVDGKERRIALGNAGFLFVTPK